MSPSPFVLLTREDGNRVAIPVDLIGVVSQVAEPEPGAPPTLVTLRRGAFYQAIEVMEDVGSIFEALGGDDDHAAR